MKRGLKVAPHLKGGTALVTDPGVTIVSPMKRGLKDRTSLPIRKLLSIESYNRFPDEQGTESRETEGHLSRSRSYNRFPDEKGTESELATLNVSPSRVCLQDSLAVKGYNRFPDEKGTERTTRATGGHKC